MEKPTSPAAQLEPETYLSDTEDDKQKRNSSMDLAAVQQSSIGVTLFKLFNESASISPNDDTDEDDDDEDEDEDEEDKSSLAGESKPVALVDTESELDRVSKISTNDDASTLKPKTSSASNEIQQLSLTSTDTDQQSMSRLTQSIHSLVLTSNRASRRSSKSGAASIKSKAETKDEDEECKKRAGLIAETLRSLGVNDDDVLVAGMKSLFFFEPF